MKARLFTAILACALFFFAGGNAFAQQAGGWSNGQQGERPDPAQIAKRQADQMKTELNLSEEQHGKILNIFKKQYEDFQKMIKNGERIDRESMQENREKMNASIKAVLTEEQFKKWTESINSRRGGYGRPGNN